MQEKEEIEFIKWFSELNKDSGKIAGGKGANLGEIYNLGINVPPGFVITAQAYDYFIEKSGILKKIQELLKKIDYENTSELNQVTKQIRELIEQAKMPKEMENEILESYNNLDEKVEDKLTGGTALDILKTSSEPIFVAVRSSATTEDLEDASFAGQQDSFLNIKGNQNLIETIKRCFASLFTSRATYYRNKKGFAPDKSSLAVVIQKMIDSKKSGVMFSRNPSSENDENIIIESVYGLGEGIVSGKITPDNHIVSRDLTIVEEKISNKKIALTRDSSGKQIEVKLKEEISNSPVLKKSEIQELAQIGIKLEEHYKKPQDTEFAIENDEIYIVQTRAITTIKKDSSHIDNLSGEPLLKGIAASPGIAAGKVRIVNSMDDLPKVQQGDVLVTKMTNPDMVVTMQKACAIITDEGGITAHAAIVSREMGIPAIVGTDTATSLLKEGDMVTVDGYKGNIYSGKLAETKQKEIKPVEAKTKTKLKVIIDLPSFAERAAKTNLKSVGLLRLEGIIAESGKHPQYFLQQNKIKEYEEVIFKGVEKIAENFEELWIRTSDIRSDEFRNLEGAPKEIEANPMLGLHGIRYGLKYPEILKAELSALKRVSEKNKKIGILLPQVIQLNEFQKVKEYLKEIEFHNAKRGIMIETPAAVQLIKDFCEDGLDFISFGTNDLTQYILAIDRGNEEIQELYDEMHPAVLYQLQYVIRVAKRNNVETSICGQAGSRKEMIKYLVENGIDSISLNADVAAEMAEYIEELENKAIQNTDEEPRKYQPKKEEQDSESKEIINEQKEEIKEMNQENKIEKPEKNEESNSTQEDKQVEEDIKKIEEEKKEYLEKEAKENKKDELNIFN